MSDEPATATTTTILCPGQGAQAVGMGRAWAEHSAAAAAVFEEADEVLADVLGAKLSDLCFAGPADRLNQTDVSQPAIYTCSVASYHGLLAAGAIEAPDETAGLSLGEYTALHLAGVFGFADGLRLVAERGRLMQQAAERSRGGMIALVGADDETAVDICNRVTTGVLVPANFNAPGQVVLSGDAEACDRAAEVAAEAGVRATRLTVAGAFHSPLMEPAAERMADALAAVPFQNPIIRVWSNVTAQPHSGDDLELLKHRLVEQIVSPVRWSQSCREMTRAGTMRIHELAPGSVLRGLMRRVDRNIKVQSHDEPKP